MFFNILGVFNTNMSLVLGFLLWAAALLLAIILFAVIGSVIYARWHFGALDGLGFPVVKPHWFLGSNPNGHNEKQFLVDLERAQTLGKVYGVRFCQYTQIVIYIEQ